MKEEHLLDLLKKHQIHYQLHHHEPLFTTEQSSNLHEVVLGAHSKNLFLKDKKKSFFLVSILDHKRVDFKALSKMFGKGGLSFSSAEDLMDKLQLTPGSVTPYALLHDEIQEVCFILDEDFLQYEKVNFHPLRNDMTMSVAMNSFLQFFEIIQHSPHIIKIPTLPTINV